MKSHLLPSLVSHTRHKTARHSFQYPVLYLGIDLSELSDISKQTWGFSHNRWNFTSIRDTDYFRGEAELIQIRTRQFLNDSQNQQVKRIILITAPRLLGYAFNPVSFYLCLNDHDTPMILLAEVNNTFDERHLYVVSLSQPNEQGWQYGASDKSFYVSPFFEVDGNYEFAVRVQEDRWEIGIEYRNGGELQFQASLNCSPQSWSSSNFLWNLLKNGLAIWKTMPRILHQAFLLHYRKSLPVITKPHPQSRMTIKTARPTRWQSVCRRLVHNAFSKINKGHLIVTAPDGTNLSFGDKNEPPVELRVTHWRFYSKLVSRGSMGLGESFVDHDWETDDLTACLELLYDNAASMKATTKSLSWLTEWGNRLLHITRANRLSRSKKNIAAHYDLSNDLFETFLDPSLTYSCAIFEHQNSTLEAAQRRKRERMMEIANVQPHHHVLEIGCGWGSFAIQAARDIGCRVTGITLSENQLSEARERVKKAGVEHLVDLQLCDYRKMEGQYDRIVSVEMLEAVGHTHFPIFFETLDRLLKPGGQVALQTITIADYDYDNYRRNCDWIQKYIFPGGHLPCLSILAQTAQKHSHLVVDYVENIGLHYAETLRRWWERCEETRPDIRSLGFDDRFLRMWQYYMCYCEAGFNKRYLGTIQLSLSRAGESLEPNLQVDTPLPRVNCDVVQN